MHKLSFKIVKHRVFIFILCLFLVIPSFLGMINTRINYDMLDYLPNNTETVVGQRILLNDFGKGAFSIIIFEDAQKKDVLATKEKLKEIDHVKSVLWYDDLVGENFPKDFLPSKVYDSFNKGNSTLVAVFFDSSTSSEETITAIGKVRETVDDNVYVTGMSALVADLKNLSEREEPVYILLAVILAIIAMMIFMDSYLIPFVFLSSIGISILWNLGTNYFFGEISYITKALASVLQLAVTMDYSIFLWHSYNEELENFEDKNTAMAHAISNTITSVLGSSTTTVAGFLALCFMEFTLGMDLGLVMCKGIILGVISCITLLPAMILTFDKYLNKTKHKSLIPDCGAISDFIIKHRKIFILLFLIIIGPAFYGNKNVNLYYELSQSLPQTMDYIVANDKLKNEFGMSSTHMALIDSNLDRASIKSFQDDILKIDGVKRVVGLSNVLGSDIPEEILPSSVLDELKNNNYELILIGSKYIPASDEVNRQIDSINKVLKDYSPKGMLIGEASLTKDLINITDYDFKVVNLISIAAIFLIIALVFKSISLPFILVSVIEFAIFINLGIPYYTGKSLPFITPICVSTIQLGSTVDYAILMTARYKKERMLKKEKFEAVKIALKVSIPSVIISAMGLFAATFGVSVYSNIDIIRSICELMARGAIISMASVIFILPPLLIIFDRIIVKTTYMKSRLNMGGHI